MTVGAFVSVCDFERSRNDFTESPTSLARRMSRDEMSGELREPRLVPAELPAEPGRWFSGLLDRRIRGTLPPTELDGVPPCGEVPLAPLPLLRRPPLIRRLPGVGVRSEPFSDDCSLLERRPSIRPSAEQRRSGPGLGVSGSGSSDAPAAESIFGGRFSSLPEEEDAGIGAAGAAARVMPCPQLRASCAEQRVCCAA